jgi:hypothetical protein
MLVGGVVASEVPCLLGFGWKISFLWLALAAFVNTSFPSLEASLIRTLTNPSSSLFVFYGVLGGIYPEELWWFSGLFYCGIVKLSLYHEGFFGV